MTTFLAYKAGCTHIVREVVRPGSPLNGREVSENVTVIEARPMVCVGYVLYRETPTGLQSVYTEHIPNLSESYTKACLSKHLRHSGKAAPFSVKKEQKLKEFSTEDFDFVRVILHTVPPANMKRTRAHVIESQVNGGAELDDRLDFAKNLLGQNVPVSAYISENETLDIGGVTKGKGLCGPVKRFGVKLLSPKARKGTRKPGTLGPWHPNSVHFSVARAGQLGHFHRTEANKLVLRVGKAVDETPEGNASTPFDPTLKHITPMGGFKNYGDVKGDFLMIKGSIAGPARGCVALRKSLVGPSKRMMTEEARIKFIDTSSKNGKGRFQTSKEKRQFFGREEISTSVKNK